MANQCDLNAPFDTKLNHCYDACALCVFVAIVKIRNKNSIVQVGAGKKQNGQWEADVVHIL